MWSFLPIRTLIDMQRHEAMRQTGEKVKQLYAEGYHVDGDLLLDELNERIEAWRKEAA